MTPRELVQTWVDAFNRRDVDSLAAFYSETATNHQVAESPVVGREAIRTMFANGFAAADMTCIPENLFQDGEWATSSGATRPACAAAVSSTSSTDKSSSSAATGIN